MYEFWDTSIMEVVERRNFNFSLCKRKIISFNLHANSTKLVVELFHRWGNPDLERLQDFPRISWSINGTTRAFPSPWDMVSSAMKEQMCEQKHTEWTWAVIILKPSFSFLTRSLILLKKSETQKYKGQTAQCEMSNFRKVKT